MQEAKTHLSRLLREVEDGGEVTIMSDGRPVVRLVPAQSAQRRELGFDRGLLVVPADFDEPLPDVVLDLFE